jgi:hypothetical protein
MGFPRISKYSLDCVSTISTRQSRKGAIQYLSVGLKVDYAEEVKAASKSKERIIIKEVSGWAVIRYKKARDATLPQHVGTLVSSPSNHQIPSCPAIRSCRPSSPIAHSHSLRCPIRWPPAVLSLA